MRNRRRFSIFSYSSLKNKNVWFKCLCNQSGFVRIALSLSPFHLLYWIDSFEEERKRFSRDEKSLKVDNLCPSFRMETSSERKTGGKRFIFFIRSDEEWWSSSASIEAHSRIRMHSTRERPEKELVQELNDRTRDKTDKNVGDVIGPPQVYYASIPSVSQPPKLTSTNRSITHLILLSLYVSLSDVCLSFTNARASVYMVKLYPSNLLINNGGIDRTTNNGPIDKNEDGLFYRWTQNMIKIE